jgi:hypothetical protein
MKSMKLSAIDAASPECFVLSRLRARQRAARHSESAGVGDGHVRLALEDEVGAHGRDLREHGRAVFEADALGEVRRAARVRPFRHLRRARSGV